MQFRNTEKKLSTVPGDWWSEQQINLQWYGDSLPIELPSCAHRPKFRSEFLNNISEYFNCLNII